MQMKQTSFWYLLFGIPICFLNGVLFSQTTSTDSIYGSKATFQMMLIPGGTFNMGGTDGHPQRQGQLDSFWVGGHEVGYDPRASHKKTLPRGCGPPPHTAVH